MVELWTNDVWFLLVTWNEIAIPKANSPAMQKSFVSTLLQNTYRTK